MIRSSVDQALIDRGVQQDSLAEMFYDATGESALSERLAKTLLDLVSTGVDDD